MKSDLGKTVKLTTWHLGKEGINNWLKGVETTQITTDYLTKGATEYLEKS